MNNTFKWFTLSLGILFILICTFTLSIILFFGFSDNIHKSDVGIILGAKVTRHSYPSPRLAARLNKGIALYQEGFFHHIIVSGGKEKNGSIEASVMKNYLLAHHIPEVAILTEAHSKNTEENAIYSQQIMRQHDFKSAMIISQYFHMARAILAFKRCGISPIYHAHANYFEWRDLYYALPREALGLYDYFFFRKYHLQEPS
jgi:uncharacterized SAM-binding protein YcdF (DUF218 family)